MNKNIVIIQGSSRSNGNTNMIVNYIKDRAGFDSIDLKTKHISPFDYDFKNQEDDFLPLMKEIVSNYDIIIFATPVYWYAMSGIMKTFFDRITDCIKLEKEIGRKLKGKGMAMISTGSSPELKEGFTMPFIESANYLGVQYIGHVHTWVEDEKIPEALKVELHKFISKNIDFASLPL